MRVIAGEFGGRKLTAPRGETTRPTADRVREAMFSALGDVEGKVVLDLFAGTGALGIEALSRGAERATFVERDDRAVIALRANLETVFAGPPPQDRVTVVKTAARAAIDYSIRRGERFDLVLIDPPYRIAEGISSPLSELLPTILNERATVVVECDRRTMLELDLSKMGLTPTDKRYGDTILRLYRPTPRPPDHQTENLTN